MAAQSEQPVQDPVAQRYQETLHWHHTWLQTNLPGMMIAVGICLAVALSAYLSAPLVCDPFTICHYNTKGELYYGEVSTTCVGKPDTSFHCTWYLDAACPSSISCNNDSYDNHIVFMWIVIALAVVIASVWLILSKISSPQCANWRRENGLDAFVLARSRVERPNAPESDTTVIIINSTPPCESTPYSKVDHVDYDGDDDTD